MPYTKELDYTKDRERFLLRQNADFNKTTSLPILSFGEFSGIIHPPKSLKQIYDKYLN